MRVLFLQRQPCIRAMKYAVALRAEHPEIELGFACQGLTLTGWYGTGDELFARWWRLPRRDPAAAIEEVVDEFRPDLIHSHNLPDLLTVLALGAVGDRVPVVHDVHDMQSLRSTPYEDGFDDPEDPAALEAAAVEGCAALVAVSQEMLDAIHARHGAPRRAMLFANYALARDVGGSGEPAPRRGGPLRIVYQGSLSTNGSHYDLRGAFARIAAAGMEIDVFPNRPAPEYRALAERTPGMRVMETLTPARLLRELPAYDAGWAGTWTPRFRTRPSSTWPPDCRSPRGRTGRWRAWCAATASAWWSRTRPSCRPRSPTRAWTPCGHGWPRTGTGSPWRGTSAPSSRSTARRSRPCPPEPGRRGAAPG
jgi:hypothetical protein